MKCPHRDCDFEAVAYEAVRSHTRDIHVATLFDSNITVPIKSTPTQSDDLELNKTVETAILAICNGNNIIFGNPEAAAQDFIVNYVRLNYIPKPTDTNVASPKTLDEVNSLFGEPTAPLGSDIWTRQVARKEGYNRSITTPGVQDDDWWNTIMLQYHAEQRQGLNELAGHGTADEQLKAAVKAQLDAAYQRGRIDEAKTCEEAKRHG